MGNPNAGDYGWKAGQSGNPNGRPSGARNKSSYELRERLKSRGDKDPAEFLSELVSNENETKEVRIAAAGHLMPYYYSKLGATPVPPAPQFAEAKIPLASGTIQQHINNIAYLTDLKSQGLLDIATADSLITDQRTILNAMIDEAKINAVNGHSGELTIRIEGGLPLLPGTNIAMPHMNGHATSPSAGDPSPAPPSDLPPGDPPPDNPQS